MSARVRLALAAPLVAGLALAWSLSAAPPGGPPERLVLAWTLSAFAACALATWCGVWLAWALASAAPRAVLKRAAAATAGVGAAALVLELPAWRGWVDYGAALGLPQHLLHTRVKPWENPSNLRDAELLYRHRPGVRFRGLTEGDLVHRFGIATDRRYACDVGYDRNGFRNPQDLERADVVVLGDSFVEAGLVAADELVTSRLAAALGVAVANLAVAGYGPQQELIVLERYGFALRPKRVVWTFFEGNDLSDAERYERARADPSLLNPERRPAVQRSLAWNLLCRLSQLTQRRRNADSDWARRHAGRLTVGREQGASMYFAYPLEPLETEDVQRLARVEAILADAAARCRASGARLVLAFVPVKLRVYAELCAFPADGAFPEREPSDLPARLAALAGRIGAAFVDLTPPLAAAARRGELVYFLDDGHWNAAGHAVAAESLAAALRALADERDEGEEGGR